MPDVAPANEGQAAFWGGPGSTLWVAGADLYDAQLEPFVAPVLDGATLRTGAQVLDVGCGTGALSRAAAGIVGPACVLACDISETMITEAARRGGARVEHVVADAQIHPFEAESRDAVVSRFGVMFFADPGAAFTNLARATRLGGNLSIACWQDPSDNEWMRAPGEAVAPILGPLPPPDPEAPGPFSMADRGRIERILHDGGWSDIEIEPFTPDLYIGGPGPLEDAVSFMMGRTAVATLLAERSPAEVEQVRTILRTTFSPHHDGAGVRFNSAAWLVRAVRR